MSEVKHTPGPWFRSGCRQKVGGADTHSIVAPVDGKEIIIASVWYDPKTHAGFHDARLIAAAPELLEALKGLLADVADYPAWQRPCHAVDVARAALAKATGSQTLASAHFSDGKRK